MTETTTTAYPALEVDDLDAAAVLEVLGEAETRIRAAERDKLVLVGPVVCAAPGADHHRPTGGACDLVGCRREGCPGL